MAYEKIGSASYDGLGSVWGLGVATAGTTAVAGGGLELSRLQWKPHLQWRIPVTQAIPVTQGIL